MYDANTLDNVSGVVLFLGLVIAVAWVILPFVLIVVSGRLRDLLKETKTLIGEQQKCNASLKELVDLAAKSEEHQRHIAVFQKASARAQKVE